MPQLCHKRMIFFDFYSSTLVHAFQLGNDTEARWKNPHPHLLKSEKCMKCKVNNINASNLILLVSITVYFNEERVSRRRRLKKEEPDA